MTLITWTKDRIREPKAREPVWYLDRETNGFGLSESLDKEAVGKNRLTFH